METHLHKYALADVPRYTSYPTAVQFRNGFDAAVYCGWLEALPQTASLSAYVHVPFCHKLCWYCGCNTSVPNGYDRALRYTGTLLDEISLVAAHTGDRRKAVDHLHFGGGTPTYLREPELAAVMERIDARFGLAVDGEVAIEADPRSLSRDTAQALGRLGFNRISFGVQDFEASVQEKINRIQPVDQVRRCVDDLRAAGIGAINFDLMYGLPGQTVESVIETARLAAGMAPGRIAVFGYAHVPWFAKHQKMIRDADLPGVDERLRQAVAIGETLCAAGYEAIGLDHYSLKDDALCRAKRDGTLRRNFQGYTTDTSDALLAFGASSIGALPQGFMQNARDTLNWSKAIHAGELPVSRGLQLSADDRLRGEVIEKLMCFFEADVQSICDRHGVPLQALRTSFDRLDALQADGLAVVDGAAVSVPRRHKLFLRTVAAAFDAHFVPAENRHAKAV